MWLPWEPETVSLSGGLWGSKHALPFLVRRMSLWCITLTSFGGIGAYSLDLWSFSLVSCLLNFLLPFNTGLVLLLICWVFRECAAFVPTLGTADVLCPPLPAPPACLLPPALLGVCSEALCLQFCWSLSFLHFSFSGWGFRVLSIIIERLQFVPEALWLWFSVQARSHLGFSVIYSILERSRLIFISIDSSVFLQ